jgi:hypothetical protein
MRKIMYGVFKNNELQKAFLTLTTALKYCESNEGPFRIYYRAYYTPNCVGTSKWKRMNIEIPIKKESPEQNQENNKC